MYYIIIFAALGLDRLIKYMVQSGMQLGESIPIITDVIHITYIHNYGAAFSVLQNKQIFLITTTSIVMVIIGFLLIKNRNIYHKILLLSFSLILGGGIGNLIDRFMLGYVVDYIDFRFFPIFNLADVCIVSGAVLMVFYVFFIEPKLAKEKGK